MYAGWCDVVLEGFIGEDHLPWDLRRRAREGRYRLTSEDNRSVTGTKLPSGNESLGPRPLLDTSYEVLSRYMDPQDDDAPSWLNSPDIKQFLGAKARMTIMANGVWYRHTTWRGVRDIAVGSDPEGDEAEGEVSADDEPEEWDAASSTSDAQGSPFDLPVTHLPILDFSFIRPDPAPSSRHPSTRTTRDRRDLTRYLAHPTVRQSVRAISFAGSSLTFRQAVEMLAEGKSNAGPWTQLENLSLAGLRSDTAEDLSVALGKLARCCSGLEVSHVADRLFVDLMAFHLLVPRLDGHTAIPTARMVLAQIIDDITRQTAKRET